MCLIDTDWSNLSLLDVSISFSGMIDFLEVGIYITEIWLYDYLRDLSGFNAFGFSFIFGTTKAI